MLTLLALFVPFFALVLLGWVAVRRRIVPPDSLGGLNVFVLFFALPAMLLRLGAGGVLSHGGFGNLLLAYGLGGATVLVGVALWARRHGLGQRDTAYAALVTVFPNTGFLGLPLLMELLGPKAAGPLAATFLVDVVLFSSLCLAWADELLMCSGFPTTAITRAKTVYDIMRTELMAGQYLDLLGTAASNTGKGQAFLEPGLKYGATTTSKKIGRAHV